jgi:serine/threonine-protein kinase
VAARYDVREAHARGGVMATYHATDRRSGALVELHVVDPRIAAGADPEMVLRLCERLAAFTSPHVVSPVDFGCVDGTLYLVTPVAAGPSLRERLARERELPVHEAARIALDVARALAYAHARGVPHGDLRPKHVTLAGSQAVVGGFALTRALLDGGGHRSSVAVAVGAPAYLSPELLIGEGVHDGRSDLYALGCMLVEMLIGEPPFGRGSSHATVVRRLSQPPPALRALRPAVPEALERVARTCLERSPADRHESAAALAAALEPVVAATGRGGG